MSELIYLYGFVPAALAGVPQPLRGIRAAPVELIDFGEFKAVVSRVAAAEFSPKAIERNLQDLAWVAERGAEHEAVVAWCVDQDQIVPASLFTLYSSADVLRQSADAQRDVIAGELKRLHGLNEWDLKVSYNAQQLSDHAARFSDALRRIEADIEAAAPGKRYLLERKRGETTKAEVTKIARAESERVLEAVRDLTRDINVLPIPATRDQLPVVLHAALLVPREAEAELVRRCQAQIDRYQETGLEISFSGPWAPYRFIRRDG